MKKYTPKVKLLRENQVVEAIRSKFVFDEADWDIVFYSGKRKVRHNALSVAVIPKVKKNDS